MTLRTLGPGRLTLMVLGIGLAVSVLAGVFVGWMLGDVAGTLGPAVAGGMVLAAIVGVLLNLYSRSKSPTG